MVRNELARFLWPTVYYRTETDCNDFQGQQTAPI